MARKFLCWKWKITKRDHREELLVEKSALWIWDSWYIPLYDDEEELFVFINYLSRGIYTI